MASYGGAPSSGARLRRTDERRGAGERPERRLGLRRVGLHHAERGVGVWPLLSWTYTPFKPRAAPRPAPYYSIRVRDPSGIKWTLLYVPSRRMMRIWQSRVPPYSESIGPYWRVVPRLAVPQIAKAVARVRPYAAPKRWPR